MQQHGEVTGPHDELTHGGREALDRLFPLVYEELRRVAHNRLRHERDAHSLDTTALVHEAYVKLSALDRLQWKNRAQFFALAAQAMRRILVDYALRRKTQKRGGEQQRISLDDSVLMAEERSEELIALDEALRRLEAMDPRHGRIVECRFFGGMSIEDTAAVLGISPATVKRDWVMARAWLSRELAG